MPLTDLHNRLSVWTAPFHISNALTGAILGLASILAFAIANASFGGDTTKVFAPIFGAEVPPEEAVSELANIEGPLTYMSANFSDRPVTFYVMHEPATGGQYSSIIASHTDRLIFGEYYNFDAGGAYTGRTGISDGTVGQQIAGSVYNVHFGNWGGLPIKLAYVVFGLTLSTIIASGMRIYFARRAEKGRPAPRLEAGWDGVVWGTPALLALTLAAATLEVAEGLLAPIFWLGLTAITGFSVALNMKRIAKIAQGFTAMSLGVTLVSYSITHGQSVLSSAAISITLTIAATALIFAVAALRTPAARRTTVQQPAG